MFRHDCSPGMKETRWTFQIWVMTAYSWALVQCFLNFFTPSFQFFISSILHLLNSFLITHFAISSSSTELAEMRLLTKPTIQSLNTPTIAHLRFYTTSSLDQKFFQCLSNVTRKVAPNTFTTQTQLSRTGKHFRRSQSPKAPTATPEGIV